MKSYHRDKYSELQRVSEQTNRSSKDVLVKENCKPIREVSEKNVQYSEEKSKSSVKRSSRSWKSLASQVTNSERMKRTSGSVKHKNGFGQQGEGRHHSRESGQEGRGTAFNFELFTWQSIKEVLGLEGYQTQSAET